MADYQSSYTGPQIDNLLGRISTAESNIESLSSDVSNLDSAVGNKVDKQAGKGLSSNDYTGTEKNKLAGLPTGSELSSTLSGKASTSSVSAIEEKIPSAASSSNKLADKAYVSSQLSSYSTTSQMNTAIGNAVANAVFLGEVVEDNVIIGG